MRFSIALVFKWQKSIFSSWKPGSIKKSKYCFNTFFDTFDQYLFQKIVVLLKSDLKLVVTTGT